MFILYIHIMQPCHEFDNAISNIVKAEELLIRWNQLLESAQTDLLGVQYDLQNKKEQIALAMMPYDCEDKSIGKLFCEDNRYSKNLFLIGRGQKPLTRELYQKFLNGIPCNEDCIKSDMDFFIGKIKLLQFVSRKLFDLLFVYIDTDGMEHFRYIPEFEFDGKKLQIPRSISSMTDIPLNELIEKKTLTATSIKSWKLFLKKK
uniref:Uncharacterized protein n=1 Tax=Ceratitis capitata TaxID=7213 RepID=W8C6J9_CERCA